MLLNDTAAVYAFIKIMVTSYMESMSNVPDFIFLTWSHYQYRCNLKGASEQQRVGIFLLSTCVRNILSAKPNACHQDPLYAGCSRLCACVRVRAPCLRLCVCEVRACMCVSVSTWMYLNLLLFTPIVQLCLGELLRSNWMSQGQGGNLWQQTWSPLALLSVMRQPLCLRFLIRSWIQKWMWWTSEVNAEGRNRPQPVFNQLPDRRITLSGSTAQRWISV